MSHPRPAGLGVSGPVYLWEFELYYPSRRHEPPALQALVEALRV